MIDIQKIIAITHTAGKEILKFYEDDKSLDITHKDNNTPLTNADLAAHKSIEQALLAYTPDIPILSEESNMLSFDEREKWQRYWLIDPLDGTKEFIAHNDEFTVNIALIENHQPVAGVVYAPALATTYYSDVEQHAFIIDKSGQTKAITTRAMDINKPTVMMSRRHGLARTEAFLKGFGEPKAISAGSSLKMCLIAAGSADIYPRFGPTSEWDTAAAHAVLRACGGEIFTLEGSPLQYNCKECILNPEFVAVGDLNYDWQKHFKKFMSE